jgi:D-alanyl-D-alanine carboxypeptidase/D-alanyl-D-alanine-endopeptidase (penicillin-binding protein 4)
MRAKLACTSRRALHIGVPLFLLGLLAGTSARAQESADGSVAPAVRAVGEGSSKTSALQQNRAPSRRRTRRTPVRTTRAVAPVGPSWTSPRSAPALAADLAGTLQAHTRGGGWGVLVVSVTRGDTLFASQPDLPLKPASIMKLMTAALALERHGPEHTYLTEVLTDRGVNGGVVEGNLYLRGGADPTLSLRFWQGESPMDALARQVAGAGVRRIRGDIVADESAFELERVPRGWKSSYLMSAYAAPVSALSLNENLVWIVARPVNGQAVVELDPPSSALPITSTVRVVAGGGGRVTARRTPTGISASGTIGARSGPRRYSLVVQEPPTFAAGALLTSLKKAGIEVEGKVKAGVTPKEVAKVAEVRSLPLASIVSYMNRESINHFAELLYRDASREENRAGSSEAALEKLREFLSTKAGVRRDDIRVADGSGLSEADTVTARSMVQLLSYAHRAPWGSVFHASMPVAGESETMLRRMRATPAQGNLHAKTGTTNTVASLAGYVTALNGEVLAFAFIYNGRDRGNARITMDRMGATLANFYRD